MTIRAVGAVGTIDVVFAAVPTWLDQNVAFGSLLVLGIVALAVMRFVQKMATRVALLALLVLASLSVIAQRDQIERCGRTCSCELFTVDVEMPLCSPKFLGS